MAFVKDTRGNDTYTTISRNNDLKRINEEDAKKAEQIWKAYSEGSVKFDDLNEKGQRLYLEHAISNGYADISDIKDEYVNKFGLNKFKADTQNMSFNSQDNTTQQIDQEETSPGLFDNIKSGIGNLFDNFSNISGNNEPINIPMRYNESPSQQTNESGIENKTPNILIDSLSRYSNNNYDNLLGKRNDIYEGYKERSTGRAATTNDIGKVDLFPKKDNAPGPHNFDMNVYLDSMPSDKVDKTVTNSILGFNAKELQNKFVEPNREMIEQERAIEAEEASKMPGWLDTVKKGLYEGTIEFSKGLTNLGKMAYKAPAIATDFLLPEKYYDIENDKIIKGLDSYISYLDELGINVKDSMNVDNVGYLNPKRFVYTGLSAVPTVIATMMAGIGAAGAVDNMVPLATKLTSNIPKIARMIPFGAISGSGSAYDAEKSGASYGQQVIYGALVGTLEAATEGAVMESFLDTMTSKILMRNGAKKFVGNYGMKGLEIAQTILKEGGQEAVMEPLSGLAEKSTFNPNKGWLGQGGVVDPAAMGEAFYGGIAMSSLLGGMSLPGKASTKIAERIINKKMENKEISPREYQDLINQYEKDLENLTAEDKEAINDEMMKNAMVEQEGTAIPFVGTKLIDMAEKIVADENLINDDKFMNKFNLYREKVNTAVESNQVDESIKNNLINTINTVDNIILDLQQNSIENNDTVQDIPLETDIANTNVLQEGLKSTEGNLEPVNINESNNILANNWKERFEANKDNYEVTQEMLRMLKDDISKTDKNNKQLPALNDLVNEIENSLPSMKEEFDNKTRLYEAKKNLPDNLNSADIENNENNIADNARVEELMESIEREGFDKDAPIIIGDNNEIIDGNHRFEALKRLDRLDEGSYYVVPFEEANKIQDKILKDFEDGKLPKGEDIDFYINEKLMEIGKPIKITNDIKQNIETTLPQAYSKEKSPSNDLEDTNKLENESEGNIEVIDADKKEISLSDYNIQVVEGKTKGGTPILEVKGETKDYKDIFGRNGLKGRWYGPKKAWSFTKKQFDSVETLEKAILEKLPNIETNNNEQLGDTNTKEGVSMKNKSNDIFPESKLKNEKGELLEVYHGTPKEFKNFKVGYAPGWGSGIYFTDNQSATEEFSDGDVGRIITANLDIKNPYYANKPLTINQIENTKVFKDKVDEVNKDLKDYEDPIELDGKELFNEDGNFANAVLKELGYDSVIAENSNGIDGMEIVIFSPDQINIVNNELVKEKNKKKVTEKEVIGYNNGIDDNVKEGAEDVQGDNKELSNRTESETTERINENGENDNIPIENEQLGNESINDNRGRNDKDKSDNIRQLPEKPTELSDDSKSSNRDSERDVDRGDKAQRPNKPGNYRITESDKLGEGTKVTKYNDNIVAIKVLKQLEEEGRNATPEEQSTLVKYVGWGGMPDAFNLNGKVKAWNDRANEVKNLLTKDEYEAARKSTMNAHFTSKKVIDGIYSVVDKLGFSGGNILEPSMGTGNFFGLMPNSLMKNSKLYGVELDSITGKIAKQLYQNADIRVDGYEKTNYPDNYFDMAISNIPFGDFKLHDPKYNKYNFNIHDYFFAKTIDKVRPGGLILFVTSKGTMDKKNSSVRKYINEKANLVGAIRLPNTAFKENALTEVTTDLVILQKKGEGIKDLGNDFINSVKNKDGIFLNEYFNNNPEMMLGKLVNEIGLYGAEDSTLKPDERNIEDILNKLPNNIYKKSSHEATELVTSSDMVEVMKEIKENSFFIENGNLYQRVNGSAKKVNQTGKVANRRKGMTRIRKALKEVYAAQLNNLGDKELKKLQSVLNKEYDAFIKQHGYVSETANSRAFSEDPEYMLLKALEKYDSDTQTYKKTDIFSKRSISYQTEVDKVDSATDGLATSMNKYGKVNIQYIADLYGKSEKEVVNELKGDIFKNPETGEYETEEEYLSGNVRRKLNVAREAFKVNKDYEENVKSLEKVQPKDLKAGEIEVRLGSGWIPGSIMNDFVSELLDLTGREKDNLKINYSNVTGGWYIESKGINRSTTDMTQKWGTRRADAITLLEKSLNMKKITIRDKVDEDTYVVNVKETLAARQKTDEIKQNFKDWIYKDQERREKLVRIYNDTFNNIRLRSYKIKHMTFPGMNPKYTLRDFQKKAVARILYGGNTLLAHPVGAGKTFEMISGAMELKRIGLVKKPMFVVPNHKLEDFREDFQELYPHANLLVLSKNEFTPKKRSELFARIANGNYDAIIVRHSSFEKIPISKQTEEEFLRKEIFEITEAILKAKEEEGKNTNSNSMIKQLEKTKANLEANLNELLDRPRDNTVTFEEMGVDSIFLDEAHNFKNLFTYTKLSRVPGVSTTKAKKSSDLYMKSQYINKIGGRLVFATATPVSNSMTEFYTMIRYLRPDILKTYNITAFDTWASNFGEVTTSIELSPDGSGYRTKERFAKFHNVPELVKMFRDFADVIDKEDLGLPLPKLEDGKQKAVVGPKQDILADFIDDLIQRAEDIKNGNVDPSQDNYLQVTNDGRMAALDLRLVAGLLDMDVSELDFPDSKINISIKSMFDIWKETKRNKSTQAVFLDAGTPKSDSNNTGRYNFDLYNDIKTKLMDKGVPEKEIAFIHDANTDLQKAELFDKVRSGDVRILIGSTKKMGEGMNVQDRLVALHHLDAPWRPSDIEQREGRIIRQGNKNKIVKVYRYVTEGSFDAYIWQTLERKAKFISQIMKGDETTRSVDDIDDSVMSYAEMKAISSGNPLIMRKFEIDSDIQKLSSLKSTHTQNKYDMEDKLLRLPIRIQKSKEKLESLYKDQKKRRNVSGDKFKINIKGKDYTERKDAGQYIIDIAKSGFNEKEIKIGSFAGFDLYIKNGEYIGLDTVVRTQYLIAKGTSEYSSEISSSPVGTISRLENALSYIDKWIEANKETIEKTEKEIKSIEAELKKPFKHEEKLKELLEEQSRINQELNLDKEDEVISNENEEGQEESQSRDTNYARAVRAFVGEGAIKTIDRQNQIIRDNRKYKDKPKPIRQVIKEISKSFSVPIRSRRYRLRRGIAGYRTFQKVIETKIDNNIGPIIHELGHHLDDKYKFSTKNYEFVQSMVDNLPEDFKSNYKDDELLGEAVAEFVRLYFIDTDSANDFGGYFYNVFESTLTENDFNNVIRHKFDISRWLNSSIAEKIESTQVSYTEKQSTNWDYKKLNWKMDYVDDLASIEEFVKAAEGLSGKKLDPQDNPYLLAMLTRNADIMARTITKNALTDPQGNIINKPLADIYKNINKDERVAFDAYLKSVHSLDWAKRGKRVFSDDISLQDIADQVSDYEQNNPHFKEVANDLYSWWGNFIETWVVDTGLLEKEAWIAMKEMYPHYVPNYRVQDKFVNVGGNIQRAKRGFANQKSPIKKASQKGSSKDTYSAIESFIIDIDRIVKTVKRREVMLSIHNLANKEQEGLGFILAKVAPKMLPNRFDARGIKVKLIESLADDFIEKLPDNEKNKLYEMELVDSIKYLNDKGFDSPDIIDNVINDTITYFTPQKFETENDIITVIDETGKEHRYEVFDELFLEALTNIDSKQIGKWAKLIGEVKRSMTVLITGGNPIFGLTSNVWRDTPQAFVMGSIKNPFKFGTELFKAFGSVIKNDENFIRYQAMGGGHASAVSANRKVLEETLNEMIPGRKGLESFKNIKNPKDLKEALKNNWNFIISMVERFNDILESAPRTVEFNNQLKQGGDNYNSRLKAIYESNDVTLNFMRRGRLHYSLIGQAIPFLNAGIQGLDKLYRAGFKDKEKSKDRLIKSLTAITLFSLMQVMFYDDDEDYQDLSNYMKDNYWLIKYADDKFIRVPKSRELGFLFGATFERAYKDVVKDDPKAWEGYIATAKKNFVPSLRTIFHPLIDVWANKSWFGKPIVSRGMEYLPEKEQKDEGTSDIAIAISKLLPSKAGPFASPINIDYLLKQYTGILGQIALPATTPTGSVIDGLKRKVTADSLYSNEYVSKFYEYTNKLQEDYNTIKETGKEVKGYDNNLRLRMNRVQRNLTKLWNNIEFINESDKLTDEEKEERTRKIRVRITDIVKKEINNYEKRTSK